MTVVADASVLVDLILRRPASETIHKRLRRAEFISAPYLIDVEFLSALRRLTAGDEISVDQAAIALDDYRAFRIMRYEHNELLPHMWKMRENLSAYDAAYVALAVALRAPVLTRDTRLVRAAGRYVKVEMMHA